MERLPILGLEVVIGLGLNHKEPGIVKWPNVIYI